MRRTESGFETSVDVKIWGVDRRPSTRKGAKKSDGTYRLRWSVEGRNRSKSFTSARLAETFRAGLLSAARRGDSFDVATGLPFKPRPQSEPDGHSWWKWALEVMEMKWGSLAPTSRRSYAEGLMGVTLALIRDSPGCPKESILRTLMMSWAFNPPRRRERDVPEDLRSTLDWIESLDLSVDTLLDPGVLRLVVSELSLRIDGKSFAASTIARRRAVLFNALDLAVERGLIAKNPLVSLKWRAPKIADVVDAACVVNPDQARRLLRAVSENSGRWTAMFALMYYAGLRPSEAVAICESDLRLPAAGGWGELRLRASDPEVSGAWTDTGRREARGQLKHRPEGAVRPVPCHPELVEILKNHLERYPVADGSNLFRGPRGGVVSASTMTRVWKSARSAALTKKEAASPLAARPYDLRHSCVSTWLAAGVEPAQVATWVGHSTAVLHRVYEHVIPGRQAHALQRIEDLTTTFGTPGVSK